MNNGYEYYYLFGLDIPLEKYGLGRIKQPKIIDFLSKDIGIDDFFYPFVINDILIGQSKDKDSILKLKESMGDLTFLIANCIQSGRVDMLESMKESLEFLYGDNWYIHTIASKYNVKFSNERQEVPVKCTYYDKDNDITFVVNRTFIIQTADVFCRITHFSPLCAYFNIFLVKSPAKSFQAFFYFFYVL